MAKSSEVQIGQLNRWAEWHWNQLQELTSLEYISKDKNPSEREVYLPITKIDIRIMMADLSDGRTCIVPRIVLQCTALAVSKTF